MHSSTLPVTKDFGQYLKLIEGAAAIQRHVDLLYWLQGDVQQCLPHAILLSGWGNFQEGSVQHDIVSKLPGVRSYAPGTDVLPFLFEKFYDCWICALRNPCQMRFSSVEYLLGTTSLPNSLGHALRGMRSVLIHGLRDERSQNECLYVMLSPHELPAEASGTAIRVLLPSIDAALRKIPLLPQQQQQQQEQQKQSLKLASPTSEEALGLSHREVQVMDWVAMGKTNSEIGCILDISAFTVKNHMQRIFQKLNVFNRAQAVSKISQVALHA
ncbi:MAG: transcriptional regulator, LuxR family [Polaromonas sp.]|nr:transcriptional regulator, LuxR family [Polaromonas sp.]